MNRSQEILYVGRVRSLEELSNLGSAAQPGRLLIIGSNALDAATIVERFSAHPGSGAGAPASGIRTLIRVSAGQADKLSVQIENPAHAVS